MSRKVVSAKQLPFPMLPLNFTGLGWLLLDRFNAPGWAFGVFWTVVAIIALCTVIDFWTREDVEIKL